MKVVRLTCEHEFTGSQICCRKCAQSAINNSLLNNDILYTMNGWSWEGAFKRSPEETEDRVKKIKRDQFRDELEGILNDTDIN